MVDDAEEKLSVDVESLDRLPRSLCEIERDSFLSGLCISENILVEKKEKFAIIQKGILRKRGANKRKVAKDYFNILVV